MTQVMDNLGLSAHSASHSPTINRLRRAFHHHAERQTRYRADLPTLQPAHQESRLRYAIVRPTDDTQAPS